MSIKAWVATAALFVLPLPSQAATLFQGYDPTAGSLAEAPNATAAAAAFDAALPDALLYDFESPAVGLTLSGDGYVAGAPILIGSLFGYNTTPGGSQFVQAKFRVTFTFKQAIDAFGAYFTGVQAGDATLTYVDGTATVLTLPTASSFDGGTSFFGFSDPGKAFKSVAFYTGSLGDYVGVDDLRFNIVPLPGTLPLALAALGAFGLIRRKRV